MAAGSGDDALKALSRRLEALPNVRERLELLATLEQGPAGMAEELRRALSGASEQVLMRDACPRLLKVWALHAGGECAERDYYIGAFPAADDRRAIREALSVSAETEQGALVLLVTVDCLRADRCSCNGYGRPTTPTLDALAGQGVSFRHAYATAGQTAQSFPGILMSNFYQSFGRSRLAPPNLTTLAEALSASGYHTVGINAANPHVSRFYEYDRGFDEFYDFCSWRRHDAASNTFTMRVASLNEQEVNEILREFKERPATYEMLREITGLDSLPLAVRVAKKLLRVDAVQAVKAAFATLEDGGRRFCWLHLMDVHEPIGLKFSALGCPARVDQFLLDETARSDVAARVLGAGGGKYGELYDAAVSYTDMILATLFRHLEDSGLMENALVCVTADHGQELLEHGLFGHGYDRLSEEVLHVPLVFSGGLARRITADPDRPVSTLDIAPTILEVCGVAEPPQTFLGTSLNDARPRPLYGQTFYEGAENRHPGAEGLFALGPFPRPVKEGAKQKVFCIQDRALAVCDLAQGTTELHRLGHDSRAGTTPETDAAALAERARAYLDEVYAGGALRRVA
jgi:arylsulfatase A-like enzyme